MLWTVLAALALLALGGLWLALSYRDLELRSATIDASILDLRQRSDDAAEAARRAHVRLDNQERQIKALADEMGWADNHAHTKVLTAKLPLP